MVLDGCDKVLIETSDAVDDRCYMLSLHVCRTRGFVGSGAHCDGCRDMLASVCQGMVEFYLMCIGQQCPDLIRR